MKNFLFAVAALLSLAACKRDEEPVSPLLGTWRYTGGNFISGADDSPFNPHPANSCDSQSTIEFKKGFYAVRQDFKVVSGTCTPEAVENLRYTYNEATKVLKLIASDGTEEEYTVSLLDGSNLHLETPIGDANTDGINDKDLDTYTKIR